MSTKISPLKRAIGAFKAEMAKQPRSHGTLRELELLLLGIAVGIFIGFSISEHHTFMESWGWAVAMSIWLASLIVGAIRDRRLRKTLGKENHAA